MSWNYRIVQEGPDDEPALILCEVYYRDVVPYAYAHARLSGDNLQEMEAALQRMHGAFVLPVLLATDITEPKT